MIKTSIITAVSLVILYNLYLIFIFDKGVEIYPQNISQDNLIKVQEYLFVEDQPKYVVVGSSLAAKLDMDQLNGFFNLAFRGKSIYDGFNIIQERREKPEMVLVEYNKILRPPHLDVPGNGLFDKIDYSVKKNVPSQRAKYQPVNILISLAYDFVSGKSKNSKGQSKAKSSSVGENEEVGGVEVDTAALVIEDEMPDDSVFVASIDLMKEYIRELKESNIQVVFFEMPVYEGICDSETHQKIRRMVKENFPPEEFSYLNPDDCSKYTTKDRLHLTEESATRFTQYFKEQIGSI